MALPSVPGDPIVTDDSTILNVACHGLRRQRVHGETSDLGHLGREVPPTSRRGRGTVTDVPSNVSPVSPARTLNPWFPKPRGGTGSGRHGPALRPPVCGRKGFSVGISGRIRVIALLAACEILELGRRGA